MFHHIHVHTEYSALDGMSKMDEYVKLLSQRGYTKAVMTDHGNINGAINLCKACDENKMQAIIGCEFYVADNLHVHDDTRYHLIAIAKNKQGYENLCRLCTIANTQGYYYKPRIDMDTFIKHKEGLIVTSACTNGLISKPFLKGNADKGLRNLATLKQEFGDDFYLEIIPIDFDDQRHTNHMLLDYAERFKIKLVASNDSHYLKPEDFEYQEMLLCIGDKKKMTDNSRFRFTVKSLFMATEDEMYSMFKQWHPLLAADKVKEAIDNTEELVNKCEPYKLKGYNIFPKVAWLKAEFQTTEDRLKYLVETGMKEMSFSGKTEYEERLSEEMGQITGKGFTDYFLLVFDMLQWARSKGILVGPGRGSSAGSLVCYLLKITNVDPIVHGTMFFRFIDPNRNDLPDIDIDFEDYRREEVKEYLRELYGRENVASIGTFGKLKGKLVVKDLCRIYDVPSYEVANVTKYILERYSADARASFTVEDAFNQFDVCRKFKEKYPKIVEAAARLEGQVKQYGVSAAGVVVSDQPLVTSCPVEARGKNKELCVGYDWRNVAHYLGLLKMDILGLNFLTIINKTVAMVKETRGETIDLLNLDLHDKEVYKEIAEEPCTGIFQFETAVMNKIAKAIHIDNFDELTACNALVRPGPFRSGSTQSYVQKKQGKAEIKYYNHIHEDITKETKGELLYQEQVMNLVRLMGKFNWEDTNIIRRCMSKSEGVEKMKKYEELFVEGSKQNGIEEREARKVWQETSYYGAWSFNKSHAVAYSMISYWCAWLKKYYTTEYLLNFINYNTTESRIFEGVVEFKHLGFELSAPRLQYSNEKMIVDKAAGKRVYIGLQSVKGLGEKAVAELVRCKDAESLDAWVELVNKRCIHSGIRKLLVNIGYFEKFGTIPEISEYFKIELDEDDPQTPEDWLYDRCSILFCDNLLKRYEEFMAAHIHPETSWNTLSNIDAGDESETKGEVVLVKGVMNKINLKHKDYSGTKGKGEQDFGRKDIDAGAEGRYCVSDFFDGTGYLRISFHPEVYRKYEKEIWASKSNAPVIIKGTIGPDRIYVKEFINIKQWQMGNGNAFTDKLKTGILSQEQIAVKIDEIRKDFHQFFHIEVESVREITTKTNKRMAFASFAYQGEVKLEVVIWPDALQRFKTMLVVGKQLWVQFSKIDKENKFFIDTIGGRISEEKPIAAKKKEHIGEVKKVYETEEAKKVLDNAYAGVPKPRSDFFAEFVSIGGE